MELNDRLVKLLNQRIDQLDNFLISINHIQEREAEISDLEASQSLTPTQEESVALIRLKNKGMTFLQMLQNDLSCDAERADLCRFCESYDQQPETEIGIECRHWLCVVPTIEFARDPSPETFDAYTSVIEKHEDCFINSVDRAEMLSKILRLLVKKEGTPSKLAKQAIDFMSQRMSKSESKGVRFVGDQLFLYELFAASDLGTLSYRVAWSHPDAADDIENAISALESNFDKVSPIAWDAIMRAYEGHLADGNVKEVGAAWQRLLAIAKRVSSPEWKEQLLVKLQRQKHRATSLGTMFDYSGFHLKGGKPLDLSSHDYIAIVFFGEGTESVELVQKIIMRESHPDLHFLMAYSRSFSSETIDQIDESAGGFTVADPESSRRYFEELLVDQVPYIVLIEKSGTILGSSIPLDLISTRVARFKTRASLSSTKKTP